MLYSVEINLVLLFKGMIPESYFELSAAKGLFKSQVICSLI